MRATPPVTTSATKRIRWLRHYIWISLAVVGLVPMPILMADLFAADFGTANQVVLGILIIAAFVQRTRFIGYAANSVEPDRRRPVEQILTTMVAVVAWAHAVRYTPDIALWALLPALVGGAGVLNAPRELRGKLAAGLVLVTVVTGALALSWRHVPGTSTSTGVLIAGAVVVVFVGVDVLTVRFWDLVLELEHARTLADELATARERLRFAADLHDIQGHSLQAIVLKGQLAERLVGKDDAAARRHAAELTELARSALADTRRLAHGYRAIGLSTEIDNAVDLMRAAGIDVKLQGDCTAISPPLQQPFGALVREGTTNLLRHSRAVRCELTLMVADGRVSVRLGNDGVAHLTSSASDGSGIDGLRERFAAIGGEVTARRTEPDWFELAATVKDVGVPQR